MIDLLRFRIVSKKVIELEKILMELQKTETNVQTLLEVKYHDFTSVSRKRKENDEFTSFIEPHINTDAKSSMHSSSFETP